MPVNMLHKSKFINLVENNNWVYATRNNTEELPCVKTNAIIIAANVNEKLCLIKEFREPIGQYQYALPAGLFEDGETIEDCAKRELFEECGLEISEILNISPKITSSAGLTDETVQIVLCKAKGEITNKNNEASERIEVLTMSPKELCALIEDKNNIFCAKTYLIICLVLSMSGL